MTHNKAQIICFLNCLWWHAGSTGTNNKMEMVPPFFCLSESESWITLSLEIRIGIHLNPPQLDPRHVMLLQSWKLYVTQIQFRWHGRKTEAPKIQFNCFRKGGIERLSYTSSTLRLMCVLNSWHYTCMLQLLWNPTLIFSGSCRFMSLSAVWIKTPLHHLDMLKLYQPFSCW